MAELIKDIEIKGNEELENKKEDTFERLCDLQKLIKKESMLKELCK